VRIFFTQDCLAVALQSSLLPNPRYATARLRQKKSGRTVGGSPRLSGDVRQSRAVASAGEQRRVRRWPHSNRERVIAIFGGSSPAGWSLGDAFPVFAKRRCMEARILPGGERQPLAFARALISRPSWRRSMSRRRLNRKRWLPESLSKSKNTARTLPNCISIRLK